MPTFRPYPLIDIWVVQMTKAVKIHSESPLSSSLWFAPVYDRSTTKGATHAGITKKIDSVLYWIYGSISLPLSSWSRSLSEQHLRNINHCSVAIWRANEMLWELNKISVLCVTTWLWDFLQCYQTPTIVLVKNICNIILVATPSS